MSGTAPRKRTQAQQRLGSNADTLRRGLALGAAAGMLASSVYGAVPAFGDEGLSSPAPGTGTDAATVASPSPSPVRSSSPAATYGLSDAALADAVQRDLKLNPQEFAAAGELGGQAAAVAVRLRQVPGYVGIRIEGSSILVTGTGSELQAAVSGLAGSIHGLTLEAPPAKPSSAAPAAVPSSPSAPAATAKPTAPAVSAPAEGSRSEVAVSTEQLFQDYVHEVGTAELQAVVASAGKFVIRTGGVASAQSGQAGTPTTAPNPGTMKDSAAPGKVSPAEFAARYANVELDGAAPLKPEAEVPGGVGYQTDQQEICSTGFSAFDPAGMPSVLTAGHCADDGAAKTADLLFQGLPNGRLGAFQFSQFGGPGNTTVLNPNSPNPGNVGADIAVLGKIRQDLDPLPAASTYGNPSEPGPDVKIIGSAAPVIGMPVCRSGWRTGWSCGHISAVGIFLVGGPTYPTDPNDIRAFHGFLSYDVQSSGGDSGGPWISGNYAVGTHSAGDWGGTQNFAVAATLQDSLKVLPGYQLELFLNKPQLVAPADKTFKAGTPVTGRVAAAPASAVASGSPVRITYPGRARFNVPVDAGGNWSFTAPEAPGPFTFTAETVNGFSRSGAVSLDIVIAPSFLPAAAITTPAGQPLPGLTSVDGTGTPGATVTLSGDLTGSAPVGPDGRWTVPLPGPSPYGKVTVTAVQTYPGLTDSPATTVTLAVMPPPPAATSFPDGQHLKQDALPATIRGTGLDGADVSVSIDGKPASGAVTGGTWSVPFPAGLAVGAHTVTLMQAVDGVSSAPARLAFTIDAPPPVLPAGNITDGGSLAATGASGLLAAALAAAAALAVGLLLTVLVRRRKGRSAR